jgi:hypothetical protein
MGVESGDTPSIRGLVMCKNCQHWQSWISYSSEKVVQGRRRRSDCMKCGKRNQFRIEQKYHKNRSPVKFIRAENNTSRELLVTAATLKNIQSEITSENPDAQYNYTRFQTGDNL